MRLTALHAAVFLLVVLLAGPGYAIALERVPIRVEPVSVEVGAFSTSFELIRQHGIIGEGGPDGVGCERVWRAA